ncbi:MAG: hypothetical protein KC652_08635 [Cyanobacteria bacterium HKST-UBA01]|nr:hypothetical protein [Cyanobacteria bacterium HKST-UBA01]
MVNTLSLKSLKSNADTGRTDAVPAAPEAAESTDSSKAGADNVAERSLNLVQSGDLKDVRNSMHRGGDAQKTGAMAVFDGANAPTIENIAAQPGALSGKESAEFKIDGVVVPGNSDLYKTPSYFSGVFSPRTVWEEGRGVGESSGRSDEAEISRNADGTIVGKDAESGEKFVLTPLVLDRMAGRSAAAEVDSEGALAGIQIEDADVHYRLAAEENGVSFSRSTENGTETVTYSIETGQALSKQSVDKDGNARQLPVNTEDSLARGQDKDGNSAFQVYDASKKSTIQITVGADGLPKSKLEFGTGFQIETQYGEDGKAQSVIEYKLDASGRVQTRTTETSMGIAFEGYNQEGEIVSQEVHLPGSTQNNHVNADGSITKVQENADGTSEFHNTTADGTRVDGSSDPTNGVNTIKTTHLDGTYTQSTENKESSIYTVGDDKGNWWTVEKPHKKGISIISRGNGNDVYESRVQKEL